MALKLIIRGYSTRLRFAPSPTGFLHLGGLRTALFNFLYAKKTDGKLILRIEDTDQSRTVKGAVSKLIKILDWAGIKFDEGPGTIGGNFGPYTQSERSDIYKNKIGILLEKEKVYRCFCTQERLARIKELSKKASVVNGYDNHCRNLTKEEIEHNLSLGLPYTIRLKIPQGVTNFKDAAKGIISFSNSKIDDCILMKSDGLPTYHFANIVDDHLMGITHVLRGDEWDGSKLSKRNLDAHVEYYKDEGFIPSALINFVAFLGWGPGTTKEFYSMKELITD
ncbi:Glutamyl-tRNA synthetase, partial [Lobulomyces angularis]